jgi:WD40 repeat protein
LLRVQLHFPNQPSELVHDAYRFTQAFSDTIAYHPLSVYFSALPFAPVHSSLYQIFHDRNAFPEVVAGLEKSWPSCLRTIPVQPAPQVVAFSPDRTRVAVVSGASNIGILDLTSGLDAVSPMHYQRTIIKSIAFSRDGSRIASGDARGTIKLWDAISGRETLMLHEAHKHSVYLVEFSPNGRHFISCSSNDGRGFIILPLDIDDLPPCRDGTFCSMFSELLIWDVSSDVALLRLDTAAPLAFSPDGTRFVLAYGFNRIGLYDTSSGELLTKSLGNSHRGFEDFEITSVVWTLDGLYIVTGSSWDGITVWNADSQTKIHSLRGEVKALAVSPDGTRIAYGGGDHFTRNSLIHMCDFALGKVSSPVWTLASHQSTIYSLAFSPDSKQLLSIAKEIRIWDTTPVVQENEKYSIITSLAFSPDGTRILSSSDGIICVWDAHLGTQVLQVPWSHQGSHALVNHLTFSPDGQRFALVTSNQVIMWNGASGEKIFAVQTSESEELQDPTLGPTSIAFSPDGNIVAIGLYKGIWMMNALSGSLCYGPLVGHDDEISSLMFSYDGTRILSGSADKTIGVWDFVQGINVLSPPPAHSVGISSVAFSQSDKRMVSSSLFELCSWDAMSGTCLFITKLQPRLFGPYGLNRGHGGHGVHDRFIITENGYIVDLATSRTLSRAPPSLFGHNMLGPTFADHEGTYAANADGQLIIVRFPSAVLTGSDTRPVSTAHVVENEEEMNDLLPIEIFYKRAGKRKAVETSSTDIS